MSWMERSGAPVRSVRPGEPFSVSPAVARVLLLYLASGLAGSLASVLTGPGPSVGASGAICGLMGGVVLILYRYRHVYHVRDKEIGLVLAGWGAYTILIGALDPRIDNWAHLGGLVCGALLAFGIRPRVATAS